MFEDAEIGSRVYLNESTGRFFHHQNLSNQIMDFISNSHKYSPRAFAETNISCFQSTRILNEALKAHALATGQAWTLDIAVHHWRPDPQLLSGSDKTRPRRLVSGSLYHGDAYTGSAASYLVSRKGAQRLAEVYKPVIHSSDGYTGRNDLSRFMYYPDCVLNGSVCHYFGNTVLYIRE